jgi:hypothetical protein
MITHWIRLYFIELAHGLLDIMARENTHITSGGEQEQQQQIRVHCTEQ